MRTEFEVSMPADVAELDAQVTALHVERAATDTELQTAEADRARLDSVLEDGADAAYDRAAAVVRTLKKRRAALDTAITTATAALRAARVAALEAEEAADAPDRDAVDQVLAQAAETLAAYEARLKDRWCRRNELELKMPSRLDAQPGRRVHQMAARHFARFGLATLTEGKRF